MSDSLRLIFKRILISKQFSNLSTCVSKGIVWAGKELFIIRNLSRTIFQRTTHKYLKSMESPVWRFNVVTIFISLSSIIQSWSLHRDHRNKMRPTLICLTVLCGCLLVQARSSVCFFFSYFLIKSFFLVSRFLVILF